ncbi:MAG: DEAD/DEAH box helicase [Crenarchaeota archaeon]|nr:DEAD/DEAH box helicase [Thermoproteota archaeon]
MLFRVVINDSVKIVREWPRERVFRVKEELKRLGFKWTGEHWRGRVMSPSVVMKLKELLELRPDEIKRILETALEENEGGAIGVETEADTQLPDDLRECIIENVGDVKIISIPCFIRNFIRKDTRYIGKAGSYEEYVDIALQEFRKIINNYPVIGNLELAIERAREFLLESERTREVFERRISWWTAKVHENYVELNFLKKGLLRELGDRLRIKYFRIDKEGNRQELEVPAIRRENIIKSPDGKWRLYFPQFFKNRIIEILREIGYRVEIVEHTPRKVQNIQDRVNLYPFQEEALQRWFENEYRGTIVIPTGGGKTFIALKAIAKLAVRTLILVITEELLEQWYHRIVKYLGYVPGRMSGKYDDLREITVCTYHTAVKRITEIRDYFDLVIADECHHVPAETFKEVMFYISAPYRMALSATVERSDGNEHLIFLACGEPIYKITYRELVKHGLVVPIRHYRIYVSLEDDEREEYDAAKNIIQLKAIALKARRKIDVACKIALTEYELGSKILIFTQYIQQAEEIYRKLREHVKNVALITGNTKDRDSVFRSFARGLTRIIVTTTVLDEGIDVPDADVAIIVSGTGSQRQMIQRVGRVVRATPGKKEARVYEIVTRRTIEEALSENRHPKEEIEEIECKRILDRDLDRLLARIRNTFAKLST